MLDRCGEEMVGKKVKSSRLRNCTRRFQAQRNLLLMELGSHSPTYSNQSSVQGLLCFKHSSRFLLSFILTSFLMFLRFLLDYEEFDLFDVSEVCRTNIHQEFSLGGDLTLGSVLEELATKYVKDLKKNGRFVTSKGNILTFMPDPSFVSLGATVCDSKFDDASFQLPQLGDNTDFSAYTILGMANSSQKGSIKSMRSSWTFDCQSPTEICFQVTFQRTNWEMEFN